MKQPKVYLVGGAPRTGKSTLMHLLMQERPMMSISTDAIRYLLRRTEGISDKRLTVANNAVLDNSPQEALQLQNKESEAVWSACLKLIECNQEDGLDIFIEGVAVLPSLVDTLNLDYRVVYLGDQSSNLAQRLETTAGTNPHDWMSVANLDSEAFQKYAHFFNHMSQWVQESAATYDQPYFEASKGYEASLQAALEHLLS